MRSTTLLIVAAFALLAGLALGDGPGTVVGYWPFEEPDGPQLVDASGNGHDGTVLNESRGVRRVTARRGGALEFTGGDATQRGEAGCVALSGMGAVDWSRGVTVEAWVMLTSLDRPATYEIVSNTIDDRGPGFRFRISWLSLGFVSGEGGAGKTWGASSDPTTNPIRAGEWYHMAGTYDGSVYRVYLDGVLAGQSEPGLTLPRGDETVFVGAYRGGYAYGLNAVVDSLRLYDYARTPAQIMTDARLSQ